MVSQLPRTNYFICSLVQTHTPHQWLKSPPLTHCRAVHIIQLLEFNLACLADRHRTTFTLPEPHLVSAFFLGLSSCNLLTSYVRCYIHCLVAADALVGVSTGSFENRLALRCIGLSTVPYTAAFNFACWFSGSVSSQLSAIAIAQHMLIYLFRSWLIEQDYTMRLTVKKI
jgi:hypothetical protein